MLGSGERFPIRLVWLISSHSEWFKHALLLDRLYLVCLQLPTLSLSLCAFPSFHLCSFQIPYHWAMVIPSTIAPLNLFISPHHSAQYSGVMNFIQGVAQLLPHSKKKNISISGPRLCRVRFLPSMSVWVSFHIKICQSDGLTLNCL